MVDEYQIEYEYAAGTSIEFKTNDLSIDIRRTGLRVDTRVDGTIVVTDTGASQMIFAFTSVISGATMNTLHGVQTGAIVYTGDYPRITKLYWSGASTEVNIEVAMTSLKAVDMGLGWWNVSITLVEKDK